MTSEAKVYQYTLQPFFPIHKQEIPVEVDGCMIHNLKGYFYNMQSTIYEDRLYRLQTYYGRYIFITTEEQDALARRELLQAYKDYIDSKQQDIENQERKLRSHINFYKSIEKGE